MRAPWQLPDWSRQGRFATRSTGRVAQRSVCAPKRAPKRNTPKKNSPFVRATVCLLLLATCGCNASWPLRNPFRRAAAPATAQTAANPTPPARAPLLGRRAYLADLQRRAEQQRLLAEQQRQRLEELQQVQQLTEEQLAQLRKKQLESVQQQTEARTRQEQELAKRAQEALARSQQLARQAAGLDRSNETLNVRLAQVQQRNQLLEDQNHLLRQRLKETADQLAQSLQQAEQAKQQYQSLLAATRRRGGAIITANNSLKRRLTAVSMPGLRIRQDGELVRIELPADQLFLPQSASLRPEAQTLIEQVVNVILRHYPKQVIGVEAHTDANSLAGTMWTSPHQLTAAQALAVFEQMASRHRLLAKQMFVMGHGDNYPLASNATLAGQARNRRVEIVIYPETTGGS